MDVSLKALLPDTKYWVTAVGGVFAVLAGVDVADKVQNQVRFEKKMIEFIKMVLPIPK